jgi:hypothetical protein
MIDIIILNDVYYRGEATEEENLEEMARTANPEEISIDEDDDEDEKIEGKNFV